MYKYHTEYTVFLPRSMVKVRSTHFALFYTLRDRERQFNKFLILLLFPCLTAEPSNKVPIAAMLF